MSIRSYSIIATLFFALFLGGCSSSGSKETAQVPDQSPQELYEQAYAAMESNNFLTASTHLEALSTRFPYGPYTEQVQLDLIYVYFKLQDYPRSLATIDRFVRQYPQHRNLDYVLYMRGLVNFESDKNFLQALIGIDRSDRDPEPARQAFSDFATLLKTYPDSEYAADARQRMIYLKGRLARHELSVAQYYMTRSAYVAAANRGQYVLEHFSDTPEAESALAIMVESYEQMGLTDLRDNALDVLAKNYPNNVLLRVYR